MLMTERSSILYQPSTSPTPGRVPTSQRRTVLGQIEEESSIRQLYATSSANDASVARRNRHRQDGSSNGFIKEAKASPRLDPKGYHTGSNTARRLRIQTTDESSPLSSDSTLEQLDPTTPDVVDFAPRSDSPDPLVKPQRSPKLTSTVELGINPPLNTTKMLHPSCVLQHPIHSTSGAFLDFESEDELTLSPRSTPRLSIDHASLSPNRQYHREYSREEEQSEAEFASESESSSSDLQALDQNTRPSLLVRQHLSTRGSKDIWSTPLYVVPGSDSDEAGMDRAFTVSATLTSEELEHEEVDRSRLANSDNEEDFVSHSRRVSLDRDSYRSLSPVTSTSSVDIDAHAREIAKGKQPLRGRARPRSPTRFCQSSRLQDSTEAVYSFLSYEHQIEDHTSSSSEPSGESPERRYPSLCEGSAPNPSSDEHALSQPSTSQDPHGGGSEDGFVIRPRRRFLGVGINHPIGSYARLMRRSPEQRSVSPPMGSIGPRLISERSFEESSSDSSNGVHRRPRKRRAAVADSEDEFVPIIPAPHTADRRLVQSPETSRAIPEEKRAAYLDNTCVDDVDLSAIRIKEPAGLRTETTKWCHNCRNARTQNKNRARCWNTGTSGDSNIRCNKTWCVPCLQKWYGFDDDAVSYALHGHVGDGQAKGTGLGIREDSWICPYCLDLCMCTQCTKHRVRVRFLPSKHAGLHLIFDASRPTTSGNTVDPPLFPTQRKIQSLLAVPPHWLPKTLYARLSNGRTTTDGSKPRTRCFQLGADLEDDGLSDSFTESDDDRRGVPSTSRHNYLVVAPGLRMPATRKRKQGRPLTRTGLASLGPSGGRVSLCDLPQPLDAVLVSSNSIVETFGDVEMEDASFAETDPRQESVPRTVDPNLVFRPPASDTTISLPPLPASSPNDQHPRINYAQPDESITILSLDSTSQGNATWSTSILAPDVYPLQPLDLTPDPGEPVANPLLDLAELTLFGVEETTQRSNSASCII
ncbi:SubName: Full=Uncharacterized protein {ECO:0000313/EMBL:CCA75310.1} [Serendipita indica DSM 11827]|nr:SubName: Full=Uncharacterized protein {ECO:0000313/EMBL:CCA75310.1} [Serendipita indica DSM 11827]